MSAGHIIAAVVSVVIGIIVGVIGAIFVQSPQANTGYKQNTGKPPTNQELWEMKQELQRLQAEINANKRRKSLKKGPSTVNSGYDYKSALDELDVTDYDLLEEWNKTAVNYYGDSEDAAEYHQKLNAIDRKLESNDTEKINEALKELQDLCYANPEDVELLYRIGRAHVLLSDEQPEDIIKEHVQKGIDALTTALHINDKHADVQKWYAILVGMRGQFQNLHQKACDGLLFKKHCDLAFALNPDDPVLHHLLGRFDYEIAGLGWVQKKVAATVFGGSLDSTYMDALKRFMTAERLSLDKHMGKKEKIENKKMIANTLVAMGNEKDAKMWFIKAERLERLDLDGRNKQKNQAMDETNWNGPLNVSR